MNIQQLQYVVAVETHGSFHKAAEACFVTPATLSIMLKKLEEELGITIFDRSKQPVIASDIGKIVIKNAREVLHAVRTLQEEVKCVADHMQGELRLGVIPTLAPYLLPVFLPTFMSKYPGLSIRIQELRTNDILEQLRNGTIDAGLIGTTDHAGDFKIRHLFSERLLVFTTQQQRELHQYLQPSDLDVDKLWLLEEEHCLRSQIMNLCALKEKKVDDNSLKFDAGSIETLLNMVEMTEGITIIPELATLNFSDSRKANMGYFAAPEPVREIGLITYRHFVKEKVLDALESEIKQMVNLRLSMQEKRR